MRRNVRVDVVLSLLPLSSAASRVGVPGTATATRFKVTDLDRCAVLPNSSAAVTVNAIGEVVPTAVQSVFVNWYVHVVLVTVAVRVIPANPTVTADPASTEPVSVTPESFSANVTTSLPATTTNDTLGGVVSTRQVFADDAFDSLPKASVATAVMEWSPSVSDETVTDHVPPAAAVPEPICSAGVTLLSKTATEALASAVPETVGVALATFTGDDPETVGAAGASVSMLNDKTALAELGLPAASVNVDPDTDTDPVNAF